MKTLLNVPEIYIIDTEEGVQTAINQEKENALEQGYTLKSYSSKMKEKKSKGEIIDSGYEVIFKKEFNTFWEV